MSDNLIQLHLDLLTNTKSRLKQALISKGIEVLDTDAFSSYPDKITGITTGTIIPDNSSVENGNLKDALLEISSLSGDNLNEESVVNILTMHNITLDFSILVIGATIGNQISIYKIDEDSSETLVVSYIQESIKNRIALPIGIYRIINNTIDYETTINITETGKVHSIHMSNITYGIQIDMSNEDPNTSVTYIDDATGLDSLSVNLSTGVCNYGSWQNMIKNFFGCKPCLLNPSDMSIQYLNPNDYSKLEDGSNSNITTTTKLAMVEFKQTWYKWSLDETNDNILRFEVSNYDRSDEGFIQAAFKDYNNGNTIRNYMYYGIYEGNKTDDDKLDSKSGSTVAGNITIGSYRNYAQANGNNFGIEDMSKRYYIMGLLYLLTKSRALQNKLGYGCMNIDNNSSSKIANGTMDDKGLFFGSTDNNIGVKVLGIENFWGNTWNFIDGIVTTGNGGMKMKDSGPYNTIGNNYTDTATCNYMNNWFWPKKMKPVLNGAAIVPDGSTATDTTGNKDWCDRCYVKSSAGYVTCIGGSYMTPYSNGGPIMFCMEDIAANTYSYASARVCGVSAT